MSTPKTVNSKRRYKTGSKFNPKDIDSMTVKELRETYDSAKAFVSACETTFSSMISIPQQRINSNINNNISNGIYNDEPLLGGSIAKTFSDYNEYDGYGMTDVYAPPTDIIGMNDMSALPLSTESYIPEDNNITDKDLDNELYSSIKEELAELLLKQQQLEQE